MIKYFIISIILSTLAFSCTSKGDEETVLAFEVIQTASFSSVTDAKELYITTSEDYVQMFNEIYANLDQRPDVPNVDFSKNDVIAVFLGAKNTGGYSIKVDKLIKRKDGVTCYVLETAPGKGCVTTQSIIYPLEIVKTPKLSGTVKFVHKQKTQDCE